MCAQGLVFISNQEDRKVVCLKGGGELEQIAELGPEGFECSIAFVGVCTPLPPLIKPNLYLFIDATSAANLTLSRLCFEGRQRSEILLSGYLRRTLEQ